MEKDGLQIFLETLLSPVGAGVFLWGAVAFIIKAIPHLNDNDEAKFWFAFVSALIIPSAAYAAQIGLGYAEFTANGFFQSIGVGYMTSQAVHRGTGKVEAIIEKNKAHKAVQTRLEHYTEAPKDEPVGVVVPLGHLPYVAPISPVTKPWDYNEDIDLSNSGDVNR